MPSRPRRRHLRIAAVPALALGVVAAVSGLPAAASAVVVTKQVIGLEQVQPWHPTGGTPPTTWWVDSDRLDGTAQVDLENRAPAGALDGSLRIRTKSTNDVAAVSTRSQAGGAVTDVSAAAYSTWTNDQSAVPRYEVTFTCNGTDSLRMEFDPTRFNNVTTGSAAPAANVWQRWNAADGKWYLDHTLNGDGSTSPASSTPSGGGLHGGVGYGHTLPAIQGACSGGSARVIDHGILGGDGWGNVSADSDQVLFNTVQTDFRYDFAVRLYGADRYQTAVVTSFNTFGPGKAKGIVLARGDLFPDALAGVPLAAALGGPLLLTKSNVLPPTVLSEMVRVLKPGAKVWVLGGTGAISTNVVADLNAQFGASHVTRLAGANRYETALAVAQQVETVASANGKSFGPLMVATGQNFPDALSAGPAAYGTVGTDGAVVLSNDTTLPSSVRSYIQAQKTAGVSVYGVGGQAQTALGGLATASFAGANRYNTSVAVAESPLFTAGKEYWGLASGVNFPDAMSGGALLAQLSSPLLITQPNTLSGPTGTYLMTHHLQLGYQIGLGGNVAVAQPTVQTAFGYASGASGALALPASFSTHLTTLSAGGSTSLRAAVQNAR